MNKKIIVPVLICLVVLGASIGVLQWKSQGDNSVDTADVFENAATTQETQNEVVEVLPPRVINNALVIGNDDAPVTIQEFSSLSCPHCASFHSGALASLKKDYVDTGKVKFAFNDFPLNQPAVDGSLLLKCFEGKDRYDLMEILFSQQSQWAFGGDSKSKLTQYAALLGLSNDKAEACMNNKNAERAMFEAMRANNQKYQVQSTPTFIIQPGDKIISGAQTYGVFSTEIEKILNGTK